MAKYKYTTTGDGNPVFIEDNDSIMIATKQEIQIKEALEIVDIASPKNVDDDDLFVDLFHESDRIKVKEELEKTKKEREEKYKGNGKGK